MVAAIVDTNVPLVANGSCEGVSPQCRLKAMDFLERLLYNGELAIDLGGLIEEEYRRHLGAGNPGVGNRFLQKFFTEAVHRIRRVEIDIDVKGNSSKLKFDGPLKKFDLSDRKFAILSIYTGLKIYNATDSDWLDSLDELTRRGVKVEFLCGCKKSEWFS